MENKFVKNMIDDLALIMEKENDYFIRYSEDTDEIMTNICGDNVYYYDMNKKEDRETFIKYLFRFLNKMKGEYKFNNKKLELR